MSRKRKVDSPGKPFVQWIMECEATNRDTLHVAPELIRSVYPALRRELARREPLAESRPRAHTDFNAAFRDGQAFITDEGTQIQVNSVETTKLVLPTGRIVTCDPGFAGPDSRPLARKVKPGKYPVVLSVLHGELVAAM